MVFGIGITGDAKGGMCEKVLFGEFLFSVEKEMMMGPFSLSRVRLRHGIIVIFFISCVREIEAESVDT